MNMIKKAFLLILLIIPIFSQEDEKYELLLNETVSEEYYSDVISNITKLLEEGYIYLDFYKSPLKPKENESYNIDTLDLIKELEAIQKKDRKFYDFYRDIIKIIRKTGDNHLNFYVRWVPSRNLNLLFYHYTIPFMFKVIDKIDDNGNVTDTYLTIVKNETDDTKNELSSQTNNETETPRYIIHLNKKIISINDTDPFEFIGNLFGDFSIGHNSQINYIDTLESIKSISVFIFPFLKEELSNITLKFEDGENYTFSFCFNHVLGDKSFEKYYIKKLINILLIIYHYQIYKQFIKNINKKMIQITNQKGK